MERRRGPHPGLRERHRGLSADAGAGLLSTLAGTGVFLALLFFAVHLLIGLHLTSVVTAVTWDAARLAAGEQGDRVQAQAHAEQLLDGYTEDLRLVWGPADQGSVTLTVTATNPNLLWPGLMEEVGVEQIERTVTVRAEDFDDGR